MRTKFGRKIAVALAGCVLLTGTATAASATNVSDGGAASATTASGAPASASGDDAEVAFYRTAGSTVWNDTGRNLPLISAEKSSRDSWLHGGPRPELPRATWGNSDWSRVDGIGRATSWVSESGFMRGAWNVVKYGDANGTVTLTSNNPFKAESTYKCETTGNLRCVAPKMKGWIWTAPNLGTTGLSGGPTLDVHFYVCSTDTRGPATPGGCPR